MNTYDFEVAVKATTESEAGRKINAACALIDRLTAAQLEKFVHVVKNDPEKVAQALAYIG